MFFINFLRISKIVLYLEQDRQETLIRIYTTLLATNTRSVLGNRNDYTRLIDSQFNRGATQQRGGEWAGVSCCRQLSVCETCIEIDATYHI